MASEVMAWGVVIMLLVLMPIAETTAVEGWPLCGPSCMLSNEEEVKLQDGLLAQLKALGGRHEDPGCRAELQDQMCMVLCNQPPYVIGDTSSSSFPLHPSCFGGTTVTTLSITIPELVAGSPAPTPQQIQIRPHQKKPALPKWAVVLISAVTTFLGVGGLITCRIRNQHFNFCNIHINIFGGQRRRRQINNPV